MSLNSKLYRRRQVLFSLMLRTDLCEGLQNQLLVTFWGIIRWFNARKFICELKGLMDEGWQALRTNMKFIFLEFQGDERSIHFRRAAIETSWVWHEHPWLIEICMGYYVAILSLWHVRWRVHHHKSVVCISAHRIFKLRDGWHLCLVRPTTWTEYK